jgi:hypothetical protein
VSIKNYQNINLTDEKFSMRTGILLPFKHVNYRNCYFKHASKLDIQRITQKDIAYFDNKHIGISLGLEPTSISEKEFSGDMSSVSTGKQAYDLTAMISKKDDYSVFGLFIEYAVFPESLSIATFEWEQPIPTALAHLLLDNKLGFPPLCQYDIINNSKDEYTLTLKTEIDGYTDEIEETKIIVAYSTNKINHTPLFNQNKINLRETREASLITSVTSMGNILSKRTSRVVLLAFDTMILEILNPITRTIFSLHDFLAVWVTPHTEEVEKIISLAKEYHPKKCFTGYQGISESNIILSTEIQSETIFLALQGMGITYVDSSLSFGGLMPFAFQRIKLPDISVKTKSANCIDGAVLFASLLEAVGIQPFVITVPGHAFVGWKPSPNSQVLKLLETTQIGTADFATAVRSGKKSLEDGLAKAKQILNNPNLTLEAAISGGAIRFIDISLMRKKGILPQTLT